MTVEHNLKNDREVEKTQKVTEHLPKKAKGEESMAKIDTAKIDGFDAMSAEEKLSALLGYEFEAPVADATEVERLRAALTKSNAEASDYKKQLRARQTEDEVRAAADEEERQKMMTELEGLRKERSIAKHKASFLALGYDEASAEEAATALFGNDFEAVFAVQKKIMEEQKKAAASTALDAQPKLSVGAPVEASTPEDRFLAQMRKAAGLSRH